MTYHLDWEHDFLIAYGTPIYLPAGCILWRGYELDKQPILSRPSYYGSYETANEYAKLSKRALGAFQTTHQLRLLDVRFLKVLLQEFFEENADKKMNAEDKKCILAATISFGLCSLSHQIKLMKYAYKGSTHTMQGFTNMEQLSKLPRLIEKPGVRVGETFVDGMTMTFLKELLSGIVDGFLSPRLQSPFHAEKGGTISPELILFNPEGAGIRQLQSVPQNIPVKNINDMLRAAHTITSLYRDQMHSAFYMTGGSKDGTIYMPPIETFNTLLSNNDKRAKKEYDIATRVGKKWHYNATNSLNTYHPPKPTVFSSIFTDSTNRIDTEPFE